MAKSLYLKSKNKLFPNPCWASILDNEFSFFWRLKCNSLAWVDHYDTVTELLILQLNKNFPPEEDSLEAEDIFDLEGTDSHHNMVSDQDDYDSDRKC